MSKILIIGATWLGDMIMSQALFKVLHKQGHGIDVLAPKWNHGILNCMQEVNQAIEMPFDHGEIKLYARYKFAKSLRANNYDECIVIPNSFKSALIAYWARIPKRTGWLGEFRYFILNNQQKLNKITMPFMVQRLVGLAYLDKDFDQTSINTIKYDYPELTVSADFVDATLHKLLLNKNILILAPGAAFGEAKKWPEEYFAAVANEKIAQGWDVWLLGSAKDKPTADLVNLKTKNLCQNLSGKLQLTETAALISQAKVVVSNDSGLLHVAAALNIPLIGIYGSTSPDFTPPLIAEDKKSILMVDNTLACRPCFKKTCKFGHLKCLRDIPPKLVIDAINNLCVF